MGKRPSRLLPELVKSLGKAESRTFKLYSARVVSKNTTLLVQLFNAVKSQKEFDNNALKVAVYGTDELETKKFEELKRALYNNVLKSLQLNDASTSIEYELKDMLMGVKVLAKRSLYKHCKRILTKAKKTAYKYELFYVILEILAWQKKIAYAESDITFLEKHLEVLKKEETDCLEKIQTEIEYQDIYYSLLIQSKKQATLRDDLKRRQVQTFFDKPLLQSEEQAITFRSRVLFHRSLGYYHFSLGDYEAFYTKNKELIALIESNKPQLKEDPSHYISVINNQVYCCGMLRKYEEVNFFLEKLKNAIAVTLDDKFKIFTQYYLNKLIQCIEEGQFKAGIKVIMAREIEKSIFKEELFQYNFYFLYAYIFFGVGQFKQTLEWLNKLLDLPKSIAREDLQSVARILNLITHFEMGNTLLVEYLRRSTYRYLKSHQRMFDTEKRILKFIRKSTRLINKADVQAEFVKLKEELIILREQPSEQPIFRYFNFIAWADSYIHNKDFAQIVQSLYAEKLKND